MTDDTEDLAAALAAMDRNAREGESIQRVLFRMALVNAYRAGRLVVDEGWRPIETAPKDGTHVMAYWPRGILGDEPMQVETWFRDDGWGNTFEAVYETADPLPTHWLPLPAPPKGEGE